MNEPFIPGKFLSSFKSAILVGTKRNVPERHCHIEISWQVGYLMSVWQPILWPSIPETDHLELRLVLLSFSGELSGCKEAMAARRVMASYETVRRWCDKFGTQYADSLRRRRTRTGNKWQSGRRLPENQWRPTLFMACSRSERRRH
jgi:hypothetical protein